MQILIVVTTTDDRHRTCSWLTDRITASDKANVARFVREVRRDAELDHAQVTEVFIFTGGVWTRHVGAAEVDALVDGYEWQRDPRG